jgi:hypothetical protein
MTMETESSDNDLVGEFDANVWAERFVQRVEEKPEIARDVGTMRAWFANAIMAGYDRAEHAHSSRPDW